MGAAAAPSQGNGGSASTSTEAASLLHGSDLAAGRHGSSGLDLFAPGVLEALRRQQAQALARRRQQQQQQGGDGSTGAAAAGDKAAAVAAVSEALLARPQQGQPGGGSGGAEGSLNPNSYSEGGNVWSQLAASASQPQLTQRLAASQPTSRRGTDSTGAANHGSAHAAAEQRQPAPQRHGASSSGSGRGPSGQPLAAPESFRSSRRAS